MFDFTRDDSSGSLKAVDLMEYEKPWAQISMLTEILEISVPFLKVVANLYPSPVDFLANSN